jgi:hypothetical protein
MRGLGRRCVSGDLSRKFLSRECLNFLYTALGLGFVIFVHELGHFAVAKWCGVRVERFSIGFGPVIWSFIKGETEYALDHSLRRLCQDAGTG